MIDKYKRQNDMLRAIESLDITPSMYKNADEKYHALADYLSRHTDVTLDMYPQGSFAIGTVVRPFKNDTDGSYDLDFICEFDLEKGLFLWLNKRLTLFICLTFKESADYRRFPLPC